MPRAPLTPGQRELADRYVPLARKLARPLRRSYRRDGDDFEGVALLALVEAAQSFDPSRNVKFATFARYRIWGALRDEQRRRVPAGYERRPESVPEIGPIDHLSEEHGRVLLTTEDPDPGAALEADDGFEALLRKTVPSDRPLLRIIYRDGASTKEAAARLGCAPSWVSVAHKRALNQIRFQAGVPDEG